MKFKINRVYVAITISIIIASCANNSASWMQDSGTAFENKKITEITLPGSHIANGYDIDKNGTMCKGELLAQSYSSNGQIQIQLNNESDNEEQQNAFIEQLNTQDTKIINQLNKGIRYLDIQICLQNSEFYTSNLYLTDKFEEIIDQINTFLLAHAGEIIILDFDTNLRSEYGYMNAIDIAKFHTLLHKSFGNAIVPKSKMFSTINELQNEHYQIIILSANPVFNSYPDIWDKNSIAITSDPQTATIKKLSLLENVLSSSNQIPANRINILPIYTEIQFENLVENDEDNEADQLILMNYLQQNISNRPGIFVTNKNNSTILENLIIQQEVNEKINIDRFIESGPTKPLFESSVKPESGVIANQQPRSESMTTIPKVAESITLSPKIGPVIPTKQSASAPILLK